MAASHWVEGTLLGTAATIVAVLCVASVGFLMLQGRIDVRRGVGVVIGCFILFGAPVMIGAVSGLASSAGGAQPVVAPLPPPPPPIPEVEPPPYDPYAGAALTQ